MTLIRAPHSPLEGEVGGESEPVVAGSGVEEVEGGEYHDSVWGFKNDEGITKREGQIWVYLAICCSLYRWV